MPPVLSWRRVLLAFDADEAGDKAAAEWTAALRYGTRCERLQPEGAKDWNELLQTHGAAAMQARLGEIVKPAAEASDPFAPDERGRNALEGPPAAVPIADPLAPFAGLIERAKHGVLPPGPLDLGPGLRVGDPAKFVLATAHDVEMHLGAKDGIWRAVVQDRLAALRRLLEITA